MTSVRQRELNISTGQSLVSWVDESALNRPTTPTSAEAAASLVLSRADFLLALQVQLVEDAQIATTDDVVEYVVSEINAAEAAGVFDAATAMTARRLVKDATTFHRADPERPGLMEAVGALPGVDLDGAAIDALFIRANRRGDQP